MKQKELTDEVIETDDYLDTKNHYDESFTDLKHGLARAVVGLALNSFRNSEVDWKDVISFHSNLAMKDCAELIQAISKLHGEFITDSLNGDQGNSQHEAEEAIADILLGINELIYLFDLDAGDIEKMLYSKLMKYEEFTHKCYEDKKII